MSETLLSTEQLQRIEALRASREVLVSRQIFGQGTAEPWHLTVIADWILYGTAADSDAVILPSEYDEQISDEQDAAAAHPPTHDADQADDQPPGTAASEPDGTSGQDRESYVYVEREGEETP